MRDYIIMTDSNTEIPWQFAQENDIPVVRMPYTIEEKEYFYDLGEHTDFKAFFDKMRGGVVPKTAILPPQFYLDFWKPILERGQDILFICFSSKLSAAFSVIQMARQEILEAYPERKLDLVDTKSISMGAGLLVYYAVQMYKDGKGRDEVRAWLEENAPKMQHWFAVEDLVYLKRTGRVSPTAAAVGTMLGVKPILSVDQEGALKPVTKVKGRKKAIRYLLDRLDALVEHPEEQVCVVMQADCAQDGEKIKEEIAQKHPFKEIWVRDVGPVVGSHAGPGTIAVLFMGGERA
nr:DegV family protein [Maliibacterium massiliense]